MNSLKQRWAVLFERSLSVEEDKKSLEAKEILAEIQGLGLAGPSIERIRDVIRETAGNVEPMPSVFRALVPVNLLNPENVPSVSWGCFILTCICEGRWTIELYLYPEGHGSREGSGDGRGGDGEIS